MRTSGTSASYRPEACVHQLFREIAAVHPDRVAIEWSGGRLSYAELDQQSDAIATRLRNSGMAESAIAVCMPRSAGAITAMLGILKAGAGYVPLDPTYPAARLAFMIEDAKLKVLLASEEHVGLFAGSGLRVLAVEARPVGGRTGMSVRPAVSRVDDAGSNNLAYIMYTSGSTGVPKGVQIEHRSIVRLVGNVSYVRLDESTCFMLAAPLGFDASTLEIWGPLLNGGRIVVQPQAVPTGRSIAHLIADHGVNTAWLTAALFNAIVDDDPGQLRGLRQLLVGGEALSPPHIRRALAALPDTELINGYGPTECTTFATTHSIPRSVPAECVSIPIGSPIADTVAHVLDANRQPVPSGAEGELYIGGRGLARGYLGRPDLDAERFVSNPFVAGERLYRTGDLVRWQGEGVLEFVGRADQQVKVRGFRIEPGEIEARLKELPLVRACAVVAHTDRSGFKSVIAYVVPATDRLMVCELRDALSRSLPDFMVPSRFVALANLPLTAAGKVDRLALPDPSAERPALAQEFRAPEGAIESTICDTFAQVLGLERVGSLDAFFDLGGNSLLALRVLAQLRKAGLGEIPVAVFFGAPTPASLASALQRNSIEGGTSATPRDATRPKRRGSRAHEPIAIIGMAGRFPGARDIEEFWANLCDGRESIRFFEPDELDPSVAATVRTDPAYVPARGVIDDVEMFDAGFFGIAPLDAQLMDPQQRHFLELAWHALEHAGYVPESVPGRVGVFGGMHNSSYYQRHLLARPDITQRSSELQVMLGNEKDYLTSRVAHKLGLSGPAVTIQTACSTSLVAVATAMDSLRNDDCEMALAGGVAITCPPRSGYLYQEGAMASVDGHTRTFDVAASGTVFSDGAGLLVLRRLADAQSAGDTIYAVLVGSAVNNDGSERASFTAPSPEGQAAVVAAAHDNAGIDARTVSYIEAHGTATPLGDPIEIEGLTRAFRRHTADRVFCGIGSVKSNIGHLTIAAGAAGLIKTALALARRTIPPSIGFERANPKIDFANSPFRVQTSLEHWSGPAPRRAGVSSFGFGGTNCHLVLEEAPESAPTDEATQPQLLLISARSAEVLSEACTRLENVLRDPAAPGLADIAYTLQVGRRTFAHRHYVVASDRGEAARALASPATPNTAREHGAERAEFVFLCAGQGSQYPRMAQGLYASEPAFRDVYDECCALIGAEMGADPKATFFSDDPQALVATSVTQPALFALEYSLAKLWMRWGLRPAALIGHSVGEIVCAALGGVMQLKDAIGLVVDRGRRMQGLPSGSMLSVRLSAAELERRLPPGVELAAENAPNLCVASGPTALIEELEKDLAASGSITRRLVTSHAFHSAMMDPVVAPLLERISSMALATPKIPILSSVTADWLTPELAMSPRYWAEHLRRPVRFAPALARLLQNRRRILIEVGPRATLSTLARQAIPGNRELPIAIASLTDSAAAEIGALTAALGRVWTCGASIDWPAYWLGRRRRRVPLPGYPFQGTRCWIDPPHSVTNLLTPTTTPEGPPMTSNRRERLIAAVRQTVEEVTGIDVSDADPALSWLDLGLDSLALTQLALQVQGNLSVKVTFREVMEKFTSVASLAEALDAQLPPELAYAEVAQKPAMLEARVADVSVPAAPHLARAAGAAEEPTLRHVIEQQLQLMAQQLAMLGGTLAAPAPGSVSAQTRAPIMAPVVPEATEDEAVTRYDVKTAFGAIARIHTTADTLTALQRSRLDALIARYNFRTHGSKQYTAAHRAHMADPRVVSGFRPLTKELTYPIVIDRSRGSRVWDIDGNEYIDVLSGFGMSLFGWQPDFVRQALHEQIDRGYEIGPQHVLAGEVAELFCRLTGADRAAFCNTGSEAVMGAMRIARTVTGRSTIALFAGAYHGIFDEVIVRGTQKLKSIPAAPGILPSSVQNVLVLDYATPQSMAILRERAHELAAVLVEPVQSRRPDLQPVEFLRELRALTQESGSLLIFDEVVTGFRAHPRGIQGLFGIQADLATYGKVVGGGFPIGVIAGKREYMDALDGGHWEYGDASIPTVGVTYFAGTFVRHPIALAAAKAVLQHLLAAGPSLQERLSARTSAMVAEINSFMDEIGAPFRLNTFASLWRNVCTEDLPYGDLISVMLRDRGIHVLDSFPCFLTTAHNDADIAAIVAAYKDAAREMQLSGFFPARQPTARTAIGARTVPATQPQREVWLADRLGVESSLAYNESVSISLQGELDLAALRRSLQELPRRHDALRSTFTADGLLINVAEQAPQLEIPLHDLTDLAAHERDAKLEGLRESHVTQPFDLEKGPLIRADLVRMAADNHVLVFTGHHIVLDGWSYWVIVKDVGTMYAQMLGKEGRTLAAAPSFADYAAECATGAVCAQARDDEQWWASQFADSVPTLDLPTDRPRPASRSTRAGREDRLLPAELVTQVRKLGTGLRASLFATLLAGFNTLLHRLTGQEDVVVGIPAAGQNQAGLGGLVGHCVNMLPLRARFRAEMTFAELVAATRTALLDAFDHPTVTFGRLLQILPIARDPARLPLISVMFNIDQALSAQSGALPGLRLALETNARRFENFELFINAADLGVDGMRLECQFNSALFERETVRRWLASYEVLLRSVVAKPGQVLGRVTLLSASELQLLDSWNDTAAHYPRESRIEDLIVAAAARYAAQPAVRAGERVVRYDELIARAHALAAAIESAGTESGAHVGLLLDRDEHLLPSLLGALFAGVAYVPLDASLPAERLNFMIQDAGIRLIVSTRAVAERTSGTLTAVRTIFAEQSTPLRGWRRKVNPDDVAYVIYTSGSTGKPKGVRVHHRAVVNFLTSMARSPGLTAVDRVAAITTLSFDIAALELLLPLTVGGEVVIVPREVAMDGVALRGLLERASITVMQATPATWRLLLTANWSGGKGFRAFCGGETLERDLAASLHAKVGELWNLYGPTETTIWSTAWRVERFDRPIPIGAPIANTGVHILNSDLQRQPVGVVGEIFIGGAGLASGYHDRPELTAERFIVHPTLGRLYRTGDLGRWTQIGGEAALECLGRTDFQVKLRGYRIEPGEIEAALALHPTIVRAVVVASQAGSGDGRLTACFVSREQGPTEAELRAFLARMLPEYMVPQRFVALQALPLTPNGKLDRAALLASSEAPAEQISSAARRATALEQDLARAFQETLSIPRIGLDDDFFASGGHSLLAAQMAARLTQQLGTTVPLRVVFECPTVSRLAAWAEARTGSARDAYPAVQHREQSGRAPLSLMQQRVWYLEQLQPGSTIFNLPTAHRLRGNLDMGLFNAAYAAMVRRQPALRTIVTVVDGEPSQVVLDEVDTTIPFVDLSGLPAEEREPELARRLRSDVDETMELSTPMLVRTRLYKLSDTEHVLLFMPHHMVFDGWSFDLFYDEMAELYAALEDGREPRLPVLDVDYADFAVWLNEWLAGRELERQLLYWRDKLQGAPAALNIPVDRPRPARQTGYGDTSWMRIPPQTVAGVRKLSSELGVTFNMTLLAVWTMLLHQLTGQDEILMGTPVRGRNLPEFEHLMGFFVNALPLRLRVPSGGTFAQFLHSVRAECIEAFGSPDVPFEHLVRVLDLPRDESRFPLYQAFFSYQDGRKRRSDWGSLRHQNVPIFQPSAAQDIGLWFLDAATGVVGGVNYNIDIIDKATADRIHRRYLVMLDAIVADPHATIRTLIRVQAEELEQITQWNDAALPLPESANLADYMLAALAHGGDRTAIRGGAQVLSYSEVAEQAACIATALQERGVAEGDIVALLLERGPQIVPAMLGAWMAGAAYLPLDPSFPAARLEYMLRDSGAGMLIANVATSHLSVGSAAVLELQEALTGSSRKADARPVRVGPDEAAYLIYTSGSTGRPKGVRVPHRAVVNFLESMRREPGLKPGARLAAVTTFSFDIALLELLLPLCVGGEVMIVSREDAADGRALRRILEEQGIEAMQATPATWRLLIEAGWRGGERFKALCGGEALPVEVAEALLERCGELWNLYGPTETTIWSACTRIEPGQGEIAIGKPIANTQIWVLDPHGDPSPIGVPGEIGICGEGVALGYHNQPELTAACFVPDRFSGKPGARLYRTGDLGRWCNEGRLQHLGRADLQVKVRGYRIELSEIEVTLARHPSIEQAVVVANSEAGKDGRLVAYWTGRSEQELSPAELRKHLRAELPDYMIPSLFIRLDQVPLTANGKVDRRALPTPAGTEASRPQSAADLPRTESEQRIAEVWCKLLGLSRVRLGDNFLDIGGHSLLVMRAVALLETQTGVRLSPRVFIFQTLEAIAAELDRSVAGRSPEPTAQGKSGRPRLLQKLVNALWTKNR